MASATSAVEREQAVSEADEDAHAFVCQRVEEGDKSCKGMGGAKEEQEVIAL